MKQWFLPNNVEKSFEKFNLGKLNFELIKKEDIYLVKIYNKTLSTAEISALRSHLGCNIDCEKCEKDTYWASAVSGARDVFIGDINKY